MQAGGSDSTNEGDRRGPLGFTGTRPDRSGEGRIVLMPEAAVAKE